jgi:ATP-dependent DNA helicase RecQ
LAQNFAQRLAASLSLPFVPVLRPRGKTQPQKEMQNSAMQLRNVLKAFQIAITMPLPPGATDVANGWPRLLQGWVRQIASTLGSGPTLPPVPVLLVDDVVDSRWTLTVASVILRQHGSGPVYPFALAKASLRGS